MSEIRTPWDAEPPAARPRSSSDIQARPPGHRGRRRASADKAGSAQTGASGWHYHHLTVSGAATAVSAFVDAARGCGVVPWRLDGEALEEDVFNLAAGQARRSLSIEGCRILARQLRERVEARHATALSLVGRNRACPFDLHTLLPVPPSILLLGPTHPTALAWLARHWGVSDSLRRVANRPHASTGRRLPGGHLVVGYSFFAAGSPTAAVATLASRHPALRFALLPRAID